MVDLSTLCAGSKVRIVNKEVGDDWADEMYKFFGRIVTVKEFVTESVNAVEVTGIRIEEDGGEWFWYDYMLESITEEEDFDPLDLSVLF